MREPDHHAPELRPVTRDDDDNLRKLFDSSHWFAPGLNHLIQLMQQVLRPLDSLLRLADRLFHLAQHSPVACETAYTDLIVAGFGIHDGGRSLTAIQADN